MIRYYAMTQKGSARSENEDRVLADKRILPEGGTGGSSGPDFFSVICDGVGSCPGGAEAAQTAAEVFLIYRDLAFSDLSIRRALLAANEEILAGQRSSEKNRRMSTTATGICIRNRSAMIFHVGDSRVYRLADSRLELLTEDHTRAWELYRSGRVHDARDAPSSERRTVTRYLGGKCALCMPAFYYDSIPEEGCLYLLCSDGLWSRTKEAELCAVLRQARSLDEKSRALTELALRKGSTDDISLVLILCPPLHERTGG